MGETEFGRIIRKARCTKLLTYVQLSKLVFKKASTGERTPVTPQYLNDIERGKREPSDDVLQCLCEALDLNIVEMRSMLGRPPENISAFLRANPEYVTRLNEFFSWKNWEPIKDMLQSQ